MAEDAIHLACERALRWHSSFDGTKSFDKWFYSILNNAVFSIINEERRGGVKVEYKEEFDLGYKPDKMSFDIVRKVEALIDELDSPKRDVARLYFLQGYTPRDICQIVDMSNNAIRQFIKRYRKVLEETYDTTMCR